MSVPAPAGVAEVVHTVAQHCSGVLQHSPHHLEYNMYSVQLLNVCTVYFIYIPSFERHSIGNHRKNDQGKSQRIASREVFSKRWGIEGAIGINWKS